MRYTVYAADGRYCEAETSGGAKLIATAFFIEGQEPSIFDHKENKFLEINGKKVEETPVH